MKSSVIIALAALGAASASSESKKLKFLGGFKEKLDGILEDHNFKGVAKAEAFVNKGFR
jgi:hypothetical protein